MRIARSLGGTVALALLAPLTPAAACPFHYDMFGGGGGYMMEPMVDDAAGFQQAQAAPSREELMARQRELFLARYPQLAAQAPAAAVVGTPGAKGAAPATGEAN